MGGLVQQPVSDNKVSYMMIFKIAKDTQTELYLASSENETDGFDVYDSGTAVVVDSDKNEQTIDLTDTTDAIDLLPYMVLSGTYYVKARVVMEPSVNVYPPFYIITDEPTNVENVSENNSDGVLIPTLGSNIEVLSYVDQVGRYLSENYGDTFTPNFVLETPPPRTPINALNSTETESAQICWMLDITSFSQCWSYDDSNISYDEDFVIDWTYKEHMQTWSVFHDGEDFSTMLSRYSDGTGGFRDSSKVVVNIISSSSYVHLDLTGRYTPIDLSDYFDLDTCVQINVISYMPPGLENVQYSLTSENPSNIIELGGFEMESVAFTVEPGTLGITSGMPVVVDPTDATKGVSVDNLASITTKLLGIASEHEVGYLGSSGVVVVAQGPVSGVPITLLPYTAYYADASVDGYTTVDPGDGDEDDLYLGIPIAPGEFYVDLFDVRETSGLVARVITVPRFGEWVTLTPTFSAGDEDTMPNAATAIVELDLSDVDTSIRQIDVGWGFTFGSAPSADAPLAVYQTIDGTTYETNPTYNLTETAAAGVSTKRTRRLLITDKLNFVLTNSTGQDITDVFIQYKVVR